MVHSQRSDICLFVLLAFGVVSAGMLLGVAYRNDLAAAYVNGTIWSHAPLAAVWAAQRRASRQRTGYSGQETGWKRRLVLLLVWCFLTVIEHVAARVCGHVMHPLDLIGCCLSCFLLPWIVAHTVVSIATRRQRRPAFSLFWLLAFVTLCGAVLGLGRAIYVFSPNGFEVVIAGQGYNYFVSVASTLMVLGLLATGLWSRYPILSSLGALLLIAAFTVVENPLAGMILGDKRPAEPLLAYTNAVIAGWTMIFVAILRWTAACTETSGANATS